MRVVQLGLRDQSLIVRKAGYKMGKHNDPKPFTPPQDKIGKKGSHGKVMEKYVVESVGTQSVEWGPCSLRSKLTPCHTGAYQIPLFRMCVSLKASLAQENRPCPI